MVRRLLIIFQFVIIAGLFSCKTYKPIVSTSGSGEGSEDYISRYKELAVSEMKRTGIPSSITLAQGMIESDFGRSRLAREANNHFGIKCHNDWKGPTIRHNDDRRNECFRKYRNPEESYYDHSDFLKSASRYSSLFYLDPSDYKGWARGLKKAGYATNPDYANMLIRKIEEYNLSYFDSNNKRSGLQPSYTITGNNPGVVQNSDVERSPVTIFDENTTVPARVQRVMENNRIKYIVVKEGDTRERVEEEFQLLKWELPKYNELDSNFPLVVGQILYLQPKRVKAEPGKEYHNTVEGDTMYEISQCYGIKLKSLYEMNRMTDGSEPNAGDKIWLRSIKTVR
ncbi:MAG TPA: glucosaminidase domain-containing protein [Bacteroidales bacterium]|nr:glucosaminidase domain-containing protein [Bacteroidales bacterium]